MKNTKKGQKYKDIDEKWLTYLQIGKMTNFLATVDSKKMFKIDRKSITRCKTSHFRAFAMLSWQTIPILAKGAAYYEASIVLRFF